MNEILQILRGLEIEDLEAFLEQAQELNQPPFPDQLKYFNEAIIHYMQALAAEHTNMTAEQLVEELEKSLPNNFSLNSGDILKKLDLISLIYENYIYSYSDNQHQYQPGGSTYSHMNLGISGASLMSATIAITASVNESRKLADDVKEISLNDHIAIDTLLEQLDKMMLAALNKKSGVLSLEENDLQILLHPDIKLYDKAFQSKLKALRDVLDSPEYLKDRDQSVVQRNKAHIDKYIKAVEYKHSYLNQHFINQFGNRIAGIVACLNNADYVQAVELLRHFGTELKAHFPNKSGSEIAELYTIYNQYPLPDLNVLHDLLSTNTFKKALITAINFDFETNINNKDNEDFDFGLNALHELLGKARIQHRNEKDAKPNTHILGAIDGRLLNFDTELAAITTSVETYKNDLANVITRELVKADIVEPAQLNAKPLSTILKEQSSIVSLLAKDDSTFDLNLKKYQALSEIQQQLKNSNASATMKVYHVAKIYKNHKALLTTETDNSFLRFVKSIGRSLGRALGMQIDSPFEKQIARTMEQHGHFKKRIGPETNATEPAKRSRLN